MRLAARLAAPLLAFAAPALADDPPAAGPALDYWHPPVTSSETVAGAAIPVRRFGPELRAGFVAGVMREAFARGYGARIAAFARGHDADELIVVALDDQVFASLQRARAVMAQLSAPPGAASPILVSNRRAAMAGINEVLAALGFRSLTISDGVSWSHRVEFR